MSIIQGLAEDIQSSFVVTSDSHLFISTASDNTCVKFWKMQFFTRRSIVFLHGLQTSLAMQPIKFTSDNHRFEVERCSEIEGVSGLDGTTLLHSLTDMDLSVSNYDWI